MAEDTTPVAVAEKPAEPTPPKDAPAVSGDVKNVDAPKDEPKTVPLTELLDARKQLKVFQDEKAAAEKKQLEDQGKWEELARQSEAKATAASLQVREARIDNQVITEATKQGIVDPDAALKLVSRTTIDVADDGTVTGVEDALKRLVVDKPYLVAKDSAQRLGSASNPADANQSPTENQFKLSQIKDVKFYKEHRDDIMKAQRLGQIEDDSK